MLVGTTTVPTKKHRAFAYLREQRGTRNSVSPSVSEHLSAYLRERRGTKNGSSPSVSERLRPIGRNRARRRHQNIPRRQARKSETEDILVVFLGTRRPMCRSHFSTRQNTRRRAEGSKVKPLWLCSNSLKNPRGFQVRPWQTGR